jgi:hypothetical protein
MLVYLIGIKKCILNKNFYMTTRAELINEIKQILARLFSDSRALDYREDRIVDGIALRALKEWAIKKGVDMSDSTESTIEIFAEKVLEKLKIQETEIQPQNRK